MFLSRASRPMGASPVFLKELLRSYTVSERTVFRKSSTDEIAGKSAGSRGRNRPVFRSCEGSPPDTHETYVTGESNNPVLSNYCKYNPT